MELQLQWNYLLNIITKWLFLNTFPDTHNYHFLYRRYDTFITQTVM